MKTRKRLFGKRSKKNKQSKHTRKTNLLVKYNKKRKYTRKNKQKYYKIKKSYKIKKQKGGLSATNLLSHGLINASRYVPHTISNVYNNLVGNETNSSFLPWEGHYQ